MKVVWSRPSGRLPDGGCFGTRRLGAGKQAIIHTGKGTTYTTSASTHLYWGRGWYVWNNTGDKVTLRRADGSLKDTCPIAVPAARSTAKARTDGWHRAAASGPPG
jgi:hypothetical protein